MNRKFFALTLTAGLSFGAFAGVKVTSLDLKTDGANGSVSVTLDGRSKELPDLRVNGNTIEIILTDADPFSAISRNVRGAQLLANSLNGKAIIKAILPYTVKAEQVNLGWKNKNIEIVFPRGKVSPAPVAVSPKKIKAAPLPEKKVVKAATSSISKDLLNEEYLDKLMKENSAKNPAVPSAEVKKDEIAVKQAAIKNPTKSDAAPAAVKTGENFSFTGYAVKFTLFLSMVLGLFYGVVQLLKKGVFNRGKLGFLNNSQMIEVLSTTYVSPKRSLMVVKAHKQIFLVANSESGLEFLSEMKDTTGLIKEGEKAVTGTNFDLNLNAAETTEPTSAVKLKENILESTPVDSEKGISKIAKATDVVKFSEELKKKAKKLKPIEFN